MNKTDKIIEILKNHSLELRSILNDEIVGYQFDQKSLYSAIKQISELDNDWPKYGDKYWTIDFIEEMGIYHYKYASDGIDLLLKKRGLMFRTEEEAREKFKEICEKLNIS